MNDNESDVSSNNIEELIRLDLEILRSGTRSDTLSRQATSPRNFSAPGCNRNLFVGGLKCYKPVACVRNLIFFGWHQTAFSVIGFFLTELRITCL